MTNTMVVGVDVIYADRKATLGLTASYTQHLT